MSWFERLKQGLSKSSNKITQAISNIVDKRKLDNETLQDLEDILIEADLGVAAAQAIIQDLRKNRFDKEISQEDLRMALAEIITTILEPAAKPFKSDYHPHIILVCGVNGNGKTTTIGKLAAIYAKKGKKVAVVACDTFRAAAVEQLEVWAERVGCQIIKGSPNVDPASVAYKAMEYANEYDVIIIDTAGRLHTKTNLMEELSKIVRVIKKVTPEAPHNTLLVLDATTGQNAYNQLEHFTKTADVNGLIVTKLDGTAKAGVVVGLAKQFAIPIHYIGVGEGIDDLQEFNARGFAENLVDVGT
jgi:fused signal recognition particle receptor